MCFIKISQQILYEKAKYNAVSNMIYNVIFRRKILYLYYKPKAVFT